MRENAGMKKDATERILDYVIRINTEIFKIHSEMGDIKTDIKGLKEGVAEIDGRLYRIETEVAMIKDDVTTLKGEVSEINMKLDWAGEKIFEDHEKRITSLELAAA